MLTSEILTVGGIGMTLIGLVIKHMVDNNKRFSEEGKLNDNRHVLESKENDKRYVNRDVCRTIHGELKEDLREIKDDIKVLLKRGGI